MPERFDQHDMGGGKRIALYALLAFVLVVLMCLRYGGMREQTAADERDDERAAVSDLWATEAPTAAPTEVPGRKVVMLGRYLDGFKFTTYSDETCTITDYLGGGGDVVIPRTLDGYLVTCIADEAFMNPDKGKTSAVVRAKLGTYDDGLTSVVIPDSVVSIGNGAFAGNYALRSVVISEGVQSIGSSAFSGSYVLESITIPEGVVSIGDYAFYDSCALTSVSIPASVTTLGERAFGYCPALMAITVDPQNPGLCSIDGVLFNKQVTTLLQYPAGCTDAQYAIPEGVSVIWDQAFAHSGSLKSVAIPDSVTEIGASAFTCSALTSLTLPDSITEIGYGAFNNCTALTSITIPDSVTRLGAFVFASCTSLREILVSDRQPILSDVDGVLFDKAGKKLLYYPVGRTDTHYAVPDGVVSIESNAFMDCTHLESVSLPGSLVEIGGLAFGYCTSLTSVEIPKSVTSILNHVFEQCANLTLTVEAGSYAEKYAKSENIRCKAVQPTPTPAPTKKVERKVEKYSLAAGDYVINTYNDGTCVITGYSGSATALTVPEMLEGYPVTGIGRRAFEECGKLVSVILPDSVTSIGERAFASCKALKSISLPAGLMELGPNAFYFCDSLAAITIPEGVTVIQSGTFMFCEKLKRVVLPEGVTAIGAEAFEYCQELTEVNLPASLTSIGDNAFSCCWKLANVTIPDGVTTIGKEAFSYCKFTEVFIPAGVVSVGKGAFTSYGDLKAITVAEENPYLASIDGVLYDRELKTLICHPADSGATQYTLPASVTHIEDEALRGCKALTEIVLPEGLEKIGYMAFSECKALRSITIPESVVSIGDQAFSYCSSLSSVTIPAAVAECPEDVFYGSNKMTDIHVDPANRILSSLDGVLFNKSKTELLVYPPSRSAARYEIPAGVKTIGSFAFAYNSTLGEIVIPDGVTMIEGYAFVDCSSLTGIVIPDSVTTIRYSVFSDCKALRSVVLPANLKTLESYMFQNCPALTDVTLPEKLERIDTRVFSGCKALKELTLSEKVKTIDSSAFNNCSNLTLRVPANSYAEKYAKSSGIRYEVIQPAQTEAPAAQGQRTVVHEDWYVGNYKLTTFSDGTCTITGYLGSETDLVVPETLDGLTVTDVGMFAFSMNSTLKSIVLPESVVRIQIFAFEMCRALTSVTLPEKLVSIGRSAFNGCSELDTLTIPAGVEEIGSNAFGNCPGLILRVAEDSYANQYAIRNSIPYTTY